jgi:integrase/recombinase XerD
MQAQKTSNKSSLSTKDVIHLEHFLEMMAAERSASNNTLESYRRDLSSFLIYANQKKIELNQVSFDFLNSYLSSMDFSNTTIARRVSSLRQFFAFLTSEEIIPHNPALKLEFPKKPKHLPKALSQAEIDGLFKAIDANDNEGIRLTAMLEVLYSTGMRITELVSLKMKALQISSHNQGKQVGEYLLIKGKGGKERIVLLSKPAIDALEAYLKIRNNFIGKKQTSEWLFPSFNQQQQISHLTRQRFGQLLKDLAIKANIDPKKVSPHKIRHSFATHMLSNGANLRVVQELLGHSDISSTQIYTKVLSEDAQNLVIKKHPLSKQKESV